MNARKVDVGIQCPLAILNLVDENIVCLSVVNEVLLNVREKWVGGAKILRRFLFKVNFDDVFGRNASSKQMLLEQLKQQITLPATANTGNNLNETIVFRGYKSVKIEVAADCHSKFSILISAAKASKFKAGRVYHNRCSGAMANFFHFPRHIFSARWKYTAEDMEDSVYEKYGINPNRTPTEAEVGLVAYCFNVSETEAITILSNRTNHFLSKVSPLDLREDSKPKVKG